MSFSFAVRGLTGAAVLAQAKNKLAEVVVQQPIHARDEPAIVETVERYVSLAGEPAEGNVIVANVNGSIWVKDDGAVGSTSVGVGISFAPIETD